ncbi:MAG TPA: YSC84-related protein [Steroidobacteraceae bacterium]|jgi:lipid-binding SYLF domain-containing protein|nr:YSC84-related protein [Steroidobacteraceae bacterium]
MNKLVRVAVMAAMIGGSIGLANAGHDSDTAALFQKSNQSSEYFTNSYGYAVFPTVLKGGAGIGAAHGTGNLYAQGRRLGHVTMNQLSVGAQLGGEGYSEIIFFRDKRALDDFTSGNFEFSADAGAIAITAAADVSVGTTGLDTSASASKKHADTASEFNHGVAVFTIAKGGLMYNVTVAGQKFSYSARSAS